MTPEKVSSNIPTDEPKQPINKPEITKIFIGAVDYEREARDAAEASMTADKSELKGVKGFIKKVWVHNIMRDYFRQKELAKARREIKDSGNIYSAEKGDQIDHNNAMKAITERFTSEFEAEMVHTEAGEKKKTLNKEEPQEKEFKSKIQELIGKYAKGEVTEDQFLKEKETFLDQNMGGIKDEKGERMASQNSLYADNLLEVARQIKQKFESDKSLEALDNMDIVIGKAKTGVRTENSDKVDRWIEKIRKTFPGGLLANEATIALVVSSVYGIATKGITSAAGRASKLVGPLGFVASAAVGGAVAGIKESKSVREERVQHSREMAKGKVFDEKTAERRKEMDEYRYETKSANELAGNLEKSLEKLRGGDLSKESLTAVLAHLNEVEARISFSDRRDIDLIRYSDAKLIEQERNRIDLARAQSKVYLRKIARGEVKGFDKTSMAFLKDESALKNYLEDIREEHIEKDLLKDKKEKDVAFEKMRVKKVAQAFKRGMLTGIVVGGLGQEALSALGITSTGGLIREGRSYAGEGMPKIHNFTPLESLRRYLSGSMPKMDTSVLHQTVIGNNSFKLPEGVEMIHNHDTGGYDLFSGGKPIAENIVLDENGGLSEESKQALVKEGIFANISSNKVDELNVKEYLGQRSDMHAIKRDLWYDNDTPGVFDKGELQLMKGGANGTFVNENGDYVYNVKQMQPDGSYHGKFSVDAQEAMKNGKLKMLLSLSRDTQGQVFEVPIDENGNAIIKKDSEIGKLFFENKDGQAIFKGRFAEVAEMMDNNDGKNIPEHVRILATDQGEGIMPKDASTTILEIPEESRTSWPAAFPVMGRKPLERTIDPEKKPENPDPAVVESGTQAADKDEPVEKKEVKKEKKVKPISKKEKERISDIVKNYSGGSNLTEQKQNKILEILSKYYQLKINKKDQEKFFLEFSEFSDWIKNKNFNKANKIAKLQGELIMEKLNIIRNDKRKKQLYSIVASFFVEKKGTINTKDIEWLIQIAKTLV